MRHALAKQVATAVLLVAAAARLTTPSVSSAQIEPGQSFTGKVVSVTDGDTYDVRRSEGGSITVRLHGVDAPESSQSYGRAATRHARQCVGGKSVCMLRDVNRYGRAVACTRA